MEGLDTGSQLARLVAQALTHEHFTLIDVGCSGGVDSGWRVFGDRLRAFGFDPHLDEVARLSSVETMEGISYTPAFVGVPPNDPGYNRVQNNAFWERSPWGRLSTARTLELRARELSTADLSTTVKHNLWHKASLADPNRPILLSEYFEEHSIADIDFIKIDVDGPDFLIARSLVPLLERSNVLGLGIETNFFGSDDPDANTFHNLDRLMKAAGFELFGLSIRRYSSSALPAPYVQPFPAETEWGRPLQGDAIYIRDAVSEQQKRWTEKATPEKLAKLAALFSLARLPDCAAELILCCRERFAGVINTAGALDALAAQYATSDRPALPYSRYIAAFEADDSRFYPASSEPGGRKEPAAVLRDPIAVEQAARQIAETKYRDSQSRIASLERQLAAIEGSTSWRMTAPLRMLVDAVRRTRRAG